MGSRRKSREYALQLLFQSDFSESPVDEDLFWVGRGADEEGRAFAQALYKGYLDHQEQVDTLIRRHCRHWRLERIAAVDRNVLRMAISEFLCSDTPRVVVINEAIEVARKYSGEQATDFVNGILDAVQSEIGRPEDADA